MLAETHLPSPQSMCPEMKLRWVMVQILLCEDQEIESIEYQRFEQRAKRPVRTSVCFYGA